MNVDRIKYCYCDSSCNIELGAIYSSGNQFTVNGGKIVNLRTVEPELAVNTQFFLSCIN